GGEQFLAVNDVRKRNALRTFMDFDPFHPQLSRRIRNGNLRTAVWPSAAQGQIESEPEFLRFFRSKPQKVEEFVRKIGKVARAVLRIVQRQRIDGLNFDSTDATFFHGAQFAFEFLLCNRWSEPPPAHHDSRVIGWFLKLALEFID